MTVFENSSSWQQMLCQLEVARMAQTCTALRSVPQFMAWGVPYVPLDNQEVAANEGNIDGAHAGPEEDGTETDEDNEDDPGVDKGFAGEVALDDGKYLPEASCPLQQFNEDVQTLLEVFAEKGTEKDCCQFLSSLSDEHGDLHRLGPRALIVRFSKMLQCIVNARTTVDEAVKMYVPFWMCHGYRMCVLCEAVSRASALPAPFFLDALRNAAVSVIHKEVHVTCMGYECRARPWTFGVGDPATGKSHAVDPHMSMVEAACNMDSSYAPGTADDHFHLVHSRTYAALESKITKTGGYGLKLSGEGHQYCNDTYAKKGHFDDSKGLRFDLMMDMSSGGRFGGETKVSRDAAAKARRKGEAIDVPLQEKTNMCIALAVQESVYREWLVLSEHRCHEGLASRLQITFATAKMVGPLKYKDFVAHVYKPIVTRFLANMLHRFSPRKDVLDNTDPLGAFFLTGTDEKTLKNLRVACARILPAQTRTRKKLCQA